MGWELWESYKKKRKIPRRLRFASSIRAPGILLSNISPFLIRHPLFAFCLRWRIAKADYFENLRERGLIKVAVPTLLLIDSMLPAIRKKVEESNKEP